ncbi:YciI family protein [Azorhizobium sp. AG788]|uniref:YciI family protein n=1 Tax=Azorhizobium sp. AG788 TaxID=2183897 RepID=UPI00313917E4
MFIATLKFADKTKAPALLEAHNAWLQRGFADGVFLLAGSLQPNGGGAILAHQASRADFEARLQQDPFVAEGVVTVDFIEVAPGRVDDRLAFLKD